MQIGTTTLGASHRVSPESLSRHRMVRPTTTAPIDHNSIHEPLPAANANAHRYVWKDGKIQIDKSPSESVLQFLYHSTTGRMLRPMFRWRGFSRALGWYLDSTMSTSLISSFVEKYSIDLSECARPNIKDYASFNDFFTRQLLDDARSVDPATNAIVAPADSKVLVFPDLTPNSTFCVKGVDFNIKKFLQADDLLTQNFEHGTLMVFRLSPDDYHRFHLPIAGSVQKPQVIHGQFESVDPIAIAAGASPLDSNERHLLWIENDAVGDIAMVAVGAMAVGKIVESYQPEQPLSKGAELGYFAYGGSTVALLFAPNTIKLDPMLVGNSSKGIETVVKMGEAIASCVPERTNSE